MNAVSRRRGITPAGRDRLARAVAIDWDWSLPASSVDKLIEALDMLSPEDLEAARLLAYHLDDAVACLQIRDMTRRKP